MDDWATSTWWWVLAGALVAIELATGTFYLLLLAVGAAAAAVTAHLGAPLATQFIAAALVGGGAVAVGRRRRNAATPLPTSENRDVNLDIGARVQVAAWQEDGTARVHYRGASWQVRHVGPQPAVPGEHIIHAVDGNELLLERRPR